MYSATLDEVKAKISSQHEGDEKQLEVIFSDSLRLIVEAPAGYGKTTTMISRIAYLFAAGKIPNPKRILGLTFSVNAALKIKREVAGKLPALIGTKNSPVAIGEKSTITNYHGFCKGILKKYGYLLTSILRKDINLFRAVGDSEIENQPQLKAILTTDEIQCLKEMELTVRESHMPEADAIHKYNNIIIRKVLPLDYITHNAIILFVLEIFANYAEVKKFYQSYYPLVVVDEFQDTNCIAWALLDSIISEHTQLLFLGDPLQRIYGFIGALPNIMSVATEKYRMTKVVLSRNYRFRDNLEMLKLDKNIRENAVLNFAPTIPEKEIAKLPIFWGTTQQEEAEKVVAKIKTLIGEENTKTAILFRSRSKNAEFVEKELVKNCIPYFYGMFTDEDIDYVEFHKKCQELFVKRFGKSKAINRRTLLAFSESVKSEYETSTSKTADSLLHLLDALMEKVAIDYADLSPEEKYTLLIDIFENRQLKQAMEYVDSQIILSTIHSAKGLEWDFVIVCDVEQWVMTFVCRSCPSKDSHSGISCVLPKTIPAQMTSTLLDDLCVFYVALTRAKKQAFISASGERFNARGQRYTGGKICCFALVDGIKLIYF